jgi:hypothetical protein
VLRELALVEAFIDLFDGKPELFGIIGRILAEHEATGVRRPGL